MLSVGLLLDNVLEHPNVLIVLPEAGAESFGLQNCRYPIPFDPTIPEVPQRQRAAVGHNKLSEVKSAYREINRKSNNYPFGYPYAPVATKCAMTMITGNRWKNTSAADPMHKFAMASVRASCKRPVFRRKKKCHPNPQAQSNRSPEVDMGCSKPRSVKPARAFVGLPAT